MSMSGHFEERKRMLQAMRALRAKNPPVAFVACPDCGMDTAAGDLERSGQVCPACGHHFGIKAADRLALIFDGGAGNELFVGVTSKNPIGFPGYEEKLEEQKAKTGLEDACVCAVGAVEGSPLIASVIDNRFMMGSMGAAVGEKITLCAEMARDRSWPLLVFSSSGGARMQEGIISLMQMAKTAAAIKSFSDSGGLFISYLTNPTMGGVSASFAFLGDVILAEPGALIGFAGPRVIEQTIKEKLPDGFQTSEFLLDHGFVDAIVPRSSMRETLAQILRLHRRTGWTPGM
jgi:acetyl-CoA carboxylase carboxyl transferase subunit beta